MLLSKIKHYMKHEKVFGVFVYFLSIGRANDDERNFVITKFLYNAKGIL